MEPIERPVEEPVEDSPAARGAPRGLPRGRGCRPHHGGASTGVSLSLPPPELVQMDGSEDENVVLPCIITVFHTITYGTKGCILVVFWIKVAISWRKRVVWMYFLD